MTYDGGNAWQCPSLHASDGLYVCAACCGTSTVMTVVGTAELEGGLFRKGGVFVAFRRGNRAEKYVFSFLVLIALDVFGFSF